jgi:hypothetical protein
MPRKPPPPPSKGPRKPVPEDLARDAVAHEDEAPGGKVRMTFRVILSRPQGSVGSPRYAGREEPRDAGGGDPRGYRKDGAIVNSVLRARWTRLGVGLVVLTVLAGCSTTTPDQDQRLVRPASRVTSVPIQTVQKKVLVPVVLNGNQTATLLLDTGTNFTVITPTLAKRVGGERPPGASTTKARIATGQLLDVSLIRLKSIGVGSARIDNFDVAVYDLPILVPGATPPITVDGLLGNDFVGLFTMTVDPRAGRLTLQLDDGP